MPWRRDRELWLALAPPPFIYLAAITLTPNPPTEALASAPGTVSDSWGTLDLEDLGFQIREEETWFLRPPGPLEDGSDPAELDVVRATPQDASEFERVSVRGFGGEEAVVPVGTIHPPIADARMILWLGRVDGEVVSVAMSYTTEHAVGVFGVATIEPARGRGYASALMRRAVLPETGLPAVLNTNSPVARRVYERLGFRAVGTQRQWRPGPVSRTQPDVV